MSAMTGIRNALAVLLTLAMFWAAARWIAPLLAPHLPGKDGLSAVLGLLCGLIPIVYKLLDELISLTRLGGAAPARSPVVSVIAGGAVLGLVAGVAVFVFTWLLGQGAEVAKGAPAAQSLVRAGVLHLGWLKSGAEAVAALFVGSWIGRRHGRTPILTILGFALLGWLLALHIDLFAGIRSMAEVHAGLRGLVPPKGMAGLHAAAVSGSSIIA